MFRSALFMFFIINSQNTIAQNTNKDTIYYLLDTLRVSQNDRMISTEDDAKFQKFYTINCACLNSGNKPVFRCNITNDVFIKKSEVSSLKFIRLTELISVVEKNDNGHFDEKFAVFFIEPFKRKYVKRRVFFLGGNPNIMN